MVFTYSINPVIEITKPHSSRILRTKGSRHRVPIMSEMKHFQLSREKARILSIKMEEDEPIPSETAPMVSAEYLARHEAINIALLDIAALERIVEESRAPIPLELLRSLEEDFRSLDELHRQLSTGLEECCIAKSQLAHQVEEEKKERTQKLEDEKKQMEADNKRKVKELKKQMKELATEVCGIDEEIKHLREQAIQACEQKRQEKKKYEECVSKLNELLKTNEVKREAEEDATRGLEELQENCLKLTQEIQELKEISEKEEAEYEKQKQECEEKIAELSKKLGVQKEENMRLTMAAEKAVGEGERLRAEAAALEAEAEALASQLADVEAKIHDAHGERDRQVAKKAKIERSIQELKEKISELEEKDRQFQKDKLNQISQVEKQIEQRGADLENIHCQKNTLQEELDRARALALAKEAEAERLRDEADRLQSDLLRREEANARARQELRALSLQLDDVRATEAALLASAEAEAAQLREGATRARAQLEPAKARLRALRQQLLSEEMRARQRQAQRAQQLRQARRRLQLERHMVGSLERSTTWVSERRAHLALSCALLRDAHRLASAQHAQRMEEYWLQSRALAQAQGVLLQSIAALEFSKEHLDAVYSRERKDLDDLMDDVAALSETAQALQKEEEELEREILDINVALVTQGPNVQQMHPIYESLCRL